MLADIGVNLTNARFDKDRPLVIENAIQAGVTRLLLTGTCVSTSQQALQLAQQYPSNLACTAGVHPHDADNVSDDYLTQLKLLAESTHVKAIGECGLDFNRNFSTPDNQRRVFQQQVELAETLAMPLFLHQRDAFEDWLAILGPAIGKVPAMVSHCFTGNKTQLLRCLDLGMYIGITGWLCDKKRGQELRDIVKYIPLDRLMVETDAPYLTPQNIRPKPKSSRNEPAYLPFVVEMLAQCTPYSVEEISASSFHNTCKVFSLDE
ncbi:MAG: TatD family hydrolase [Thalassotalea sp.]